MTEGARGKMDAGLHPPYGRGAGGNGRPATEAEQQAGDVLIPLGFVRELVVPTGERGPGCPPHYKIDLGYSAKKIAVEIDGSSHLNRADIDRRKDTWLIAQGWLVLRVPARLIAGALPWLLEQCSPSGAFVPEVRRYTTLK